MCVKVVGSCTVTAPGETNGYGKKDYEILLPGRSFTDVQVQAVQTERNLAGSFCEKDYCGKEKATASYRDGMNYDEE